MNLLAMAATFALGGGAFLVYSPFGLEGDIYRPVRNFGLALIGGGVVISVIGIVFWRRYRKLL